MNQANYDAVIAKRPMVLGIGRGHSFRLGAMVLEHNDRLVQVGVTSSEASGTYAVEDAFELEMPTRVLGLDEAGEWIKIVNLNSKKILFLYYVRNCSIHRQ